MRDVPSLRSILLALAAASRCDRPTMRATYLASARVQLAAMREAVQRAERTLDDLEREMVRAAGVDSKPANGATT